MKDLNLLDPNKAIEMLLTNLYFSEFEVIDGLNQHPKGQNFYEWLFAKKLIDKSELNENLLRIKEENMQDILSDFEN